MTNFDTWIKHTRSQNWTPTNLSYSWRNFILNTLDLSQLLPNEFGHDQGQQTKSSWNWYLMTHFRWIFNIFSSLAVIPFVMHKPVLERNIPNSRFDRVSKTKISTLFEKFRKPSTMAHASDCTRDSKISQPKNFNFLYRIAVLSVNFLPDGRIRLRYCHPWKIE